MRFFQREVVLFSLFHKSNATETEVERNTTKFRARKAHGNLYRWQESGGHTCARKGGCCTRAKWDLHARARARRRFRFQSTTRRRDSGTHSTNYVQRSALSRSVLRRVEKRKLRREQFRNSDANALINRSCFRREIIWIFGASRWQEIPRFSRDLARGVSPYHSIFIPLQSANRWGKTRMTLSRSSVCPFYVQALRQKLSEFSTRRRDFPWKETACVRANLDRLCFI